MAKIVDGHCSECRARLHLGAEIVEKGGVEYRGCWNCKAPIEEEKAPEPVEEMKPRNFAWGEGPAEAPIPVPEPPTPEPAPAAAPQVAQPQEEKEPPMTSYEAWKAKQVEAEAK